MSPLIILFRWADAKRTAVDWSGLLVLVGAAFAGGLLGSYLGARRFRGLWLRRILGVVLLVATVKLLRTAFPGSP